MRITPPFHAEHLGSLVRPPELREARGRWAKGDLEGAARTATENRCIREVVIQQEQAGLQTVTDGDFRRATWCDGFLVNVDGFKLQAYKWPPSREIPVVSGKIARRFPIAVQEFLFIKEHAQSVPKVTLPSPTFMHPVSGMVLVEHTAYPHIEGFLTDVAEIYRDEISHLGRAGCPYLQLDDLVLSMICSGAADKAMRSRGEDPDALIELLIETINAALRDRPEGMSVCLNLCRDNLVGGTVFPVRASALEKIFRTLEVDGYFIGYGLRAEGEFTPLRCVPDNKSVSLGIVDFGVPAPAPFEEITARVLDASRYIDLSRLGISPQRGFAREFDSDATSYDEQGWRLRHLVECAERIWADSYSGARVMTMASPSA